MRPGGTEEKKYFNPRSPHGERLLTFVARAQESNISIHAPRTGSDAAASSVCHPDKEISIHAPRTGSDGDPGFYESWDEIFQSTLPARGATEDGQRHDAHQPISIHAPRTGSDQRIQIKTGLVPISIHAPRTGSDGLSPGTGGPHEISIHAPRTGSDA